MFAQLQSYTVTTLTEFQQRINTEFTINYILCLLKIGKVTVRILVPEPRGCYSHLMQSI